MLDLNTENSLLFIIDIQEKLLNAVFNKEILRIKCEILSKASNILNLPAIITEQYSKGLGKTADEIISNLRESSYKIFEKTSFNALSDENILKSLKKQKRKNIILCGIETHICVYQTALALLKNGYNVILVQDVCSSRAETEHLSATEVLKNEGAKLRTLEMILFELLKTSKHPHFKEIQSLIK